MDVRIVEVESKKLVCIRVVGRRQELSHRAPLAWIELVENLDSIEHRAEPDVFYGAFAEADHSGDGHYRYWVGVEVSTFGARPPSMVELEIPGGAFAVATIRGGADRIDPAYRATSELLASRGIGGPYGFERYDTRRQRPTPPYEGFDYDVYRPVERGPGRSA